MATAVHRISAIMPVYNGLPHCLATLQSVLQQTRLPDEIVIIDDGSSDGSLDALKAALEEVAGERTPRCTFLQQPNAGQSAARNAAAAVATGDLLAFIDQDDLWTPEHLELLAASFEAEPRLGWAYSDFDEIDAGGAQVVERYMAYHGFDRPKLAVPDILVADVMVLPSASMLRAEAFREVGGFDVRLCGYEDDDLFLRIFQAGWRSLQLPQALTKFRVHSTSSSAGERFQQSRIQFLDNVIATVPDNPRLDRRWAHDLAFVRLLHATRMEHAAALRAGDHAAATRLAATAGELSQRFPGASAKSRLRLRLMAHPMLMRRLVAVYEHLPARLRRRRAA